MPASRAAVCAALLTIAGLAVAGCGDPDRSEDTRAGASATGQATPRPSGTATASRQEEQMKISIAIGDERLSATIFDSAAGRDLIAQLPLTIAMTDHGSVEKTGSLPSPLSTAGQPDGADPDVGDVGYYAPGTDFVLYYGDQSYYNGIKIIGRLDGEVVVLSELLDGPEPGLGRGGLLRTAPEDQDPVIGRRRRGNAGRDQRDRECECAGEQEESARGLTHGVLQGVVPVARLPKLRRNSEHAGGERRRL